jgi:hypothetical protein
MNNWLKPSTIDREENWICTSEPRKNIEISSKIMKLISTTNTIYFNIPIAFAHLHAIDMLIQIQNKKGQSKFHSYRMHWVFSKLRKNVEISRSKYPISLHEV